MELTQDLPVVDLNDLEKNPFDFYLQPGDVVEAEIEGIGTLRNKVIAWEERYGQPAPQRVDW